MSPRFFPGLPTKDDLAVALELPPGAAAGPVAAPPRGLGAALRAAVGSRPPWLQRRRQGSCR